MRSLLLVLLLASSAFAATPGDYIMSGVYQDTGPISVRATNEKTVYLLYRDGKRYDVRVFGPNLDISDPYDKKYDEVCFVSRSLEISCSVNLARFSDFAPGSGMYQAVSAIVRNNEPGIYR